MSEDDKEHEEALKELVDGGFAQVIDGRVLLTEKGETRAANLIKQRFIDQRAKGGPARALANIDECLRMAKIAQNGVRAFGDLYESITDLLRVSTTLTEPQRAALFVAAQAVRESFRCPE